LASVRLAGLPHAVPSLFADAGPVALNTKLKDGPVAPVPAAFPVMATWKRPPSFRSKPRLPLT